MIEKQHAAATLIINDGINSENLSEFYDLRKNYDTLNTIRVDTGTMNEIFSSGKIQIIKDIEVRNALNSYRMLVEGTDAWHVSYRNGVGDMIIKLQHEAPIGLRGEKDQFMLSIETLNKNKLSIFNAMKIMHDLNSIQLRFANFHIRSLTNLHDRLQSSIGQNQ